MIDPPPRANAARSGAMAAAFARFSTRIAHLAGRPLAFVTACVLIVMWAAAGPIFRFSDTWQLVINTGTTIATFLMVFLIQNTQNRDGAAVQAKLDELIRVTKHARDTLIGIEQLPEEVVEEIREESDVTLQPVSASRSPQSSAPPRHSPQK